MRRFITAVMMVALVCGFAASSYAQIGFNGIGGRLGFVKPESIDGTVAFGVHANLGEVIENLVLFPSIDYWTKSEGPLDFSQLGINADARYYFPSGGDMSFFAGGGLGILITSADIDLGPFGSADASSTDIGLDLLGGLDMPVGENLIFTAEARLVLSDLQSFKIFAGITYALGN